MPFDAKFFLNDIAPNINERLSNINESNMKETPWVPLPYIGNVSNKVGGYLRRKLKWKVTFTPGVKVQHLLNNIKDKDEKPPAGVYLIPCGTCNHEYYEETERDLDTRKDEHEGNVRRREYNKSAIAKHVIRNRGHEISWTESKLIIKETHHYMHKIKEGLAIQQSKFPIMSIQGLVLSNSWQPLIPDISEFYTKPK